MVAKLPTSPGSPVDPIAGVERRAGRVVVHLVGEIDLHNAELLHERVAPLIGNNIELDASGLEFIDSSGLGIVVGLARQAEREGLTLHVSHVRTSIRRIFEITGLDALVE